MTAGKEPHQEKGSHEKGAELGNIFPPFKTWNQLYAFILVELVGLIVLLYFFGKTFA